MTSILYLLSYLHCSKNKLLHFFTSFAMVIANCKNYYYGLMHLLLTDHWLQKLKIFFWPIFVIIVKLNIVSFVLLMSFYFVTPFH